MKEQFDFIDFIDSAKIHLSSISTVTSALLHLAREHPDDSLNDVAITLHHNIGHLRDLFKKITDQYEKQKH